MEFYCPNCGYANSNRSDVSCSACGYVWDERAYESLMKQNADKSAAKKKSKKETKKGDKQK